MPTSQKTTGMGMRSAVAILAVTVTAMVMIETKLPPTTNTKGSIYRSTGPTFARRFRRSFTTASNPNRKLETEVPELRRSATARSEPPLEEESGVDTASDSQTLVNIDNTNETKR